MLTKITATVASLMVATSANAVELTEKQVKESATIYANAACSVYTDSPMFAGLNVQTNTRAMIRVDRFIASRAGSDHANVYNLAQLHPKYKPIADDAYWGVMVRCDPFINNWLQ